jgi:hypothetical protein
MTSCRWPSCRSIHPCSHYRNDVTTLSHFVKGFLKYTPEFTVLSHHYWHNTFQLASDIAPKDVVWYCNFSWEGEVSASELPDSIWNLKTSFPAKWHFYIDHHDAQWCWELLLTAQSPDDSSGHFFWADPLHISQTSLSAPAHLIFKAQTISYGAMSQARHMEYVLPTPVTWSSKFGLYSRYPQECGTELRQPLHHDCSSVLNNMVGTYIVSHTNRND